MNFLILRDFSRFFLNFYEFIWIYLNLILLKTYKKMFLLSCAERVECLRGSVRGWSACVAVYVDGVLACQCTHRPRGAHVSMRTHVISGLSIPFNNIS